MSYLEMKRLIKSIKKIYSWYIEVNNNSGKNTKDSKQGQQTKVACAQLIQILPKIE